MPVVVIISIVYVIYSAISDRIKQTRAEDRYRREQLDKK